MELEYIILNEGRGFALYRKLHAGEEKWYTEEQHRLKKYEDGLWLRLRYSVERAELEPLEGRYSGNI